MDTSNLRETYELLTSAAEAGRFTAPSPSEWSTASVMAHVIATNRTLCWLGIQLLDGRDVSYEGGTLSADPAWLESIVESAGDFDGLVRSLRLSYEELLALASRFDDAAASRMFPAVIYDGRGNVQFDRALCYADLLLKYLTVHMRNHTQQIQALQGAAAS